MATSKNASGANSFATRAASEIKESVLARVATLGVLLTFLAIAIEAAIRSGFLVRGISGIWATIFLLWGVALVVAGTVGRTLIWWRRR
ncbi:hypothetical protein ACFQMA_18895 [Halosimplex aquaticum]|uniref:Uncharacterized protein n=1 Tax=Halosimplex aquaticum TaxID=3026162 RepID=A0ABD5Y7U8_9EURY|nr:hypothetical protein [Halosimplex aquaticum]